MEGEEETKECSNCKRGIPAANFVMHSMHCLRNIKLCPVCKEPVTAEELQDHHERMHSLVPCQRCGESVCGTDLEDHIRDSCAHTLRTCRFCELEVRRGSIPQHEGYCGARTEKCEDCGAFVMAKYRQLHLQSNHGFIKLDDEPDPTPALAPRLLSPRSPRPSNPRPASSTPIERVKRTIERDRGHDHGIWANEDFAARTRQGGLENSTRLAVEVSSGSEPTVQRIPAANLGLKKRSNDQPQVNINTAAGKVDKTISQGGAIRKQRPAPRSPPHKDSKREMAYQRALQRRSSEERQQQEQTAYNLSVGLPPVLSAAEKLEKLRKMDAVQNPSTTPNDYKKCLQGRVWKPLPQNYQTTGYVLGSKSKNQATKTNQYTTQAKKRDRNNNRNVNSDTLTVNDSSEDIESDLEVSYFADDVIVISSENSDELTQNDVTYYSATRSVSPNLTVDQAASPGHNPAASPGQNPARSPGQNPAPSQNQAVNKTKPVQLRYDFKNLRAMSEEEFQQRLQDIQLREQQRLKDDRFNAIKTSLRELRRDLYEVTAPYNASNNVQLPNQNQAIDAEVQLPCEFCSTLIPASELVLHQTGCRPVLTCLPENSSDEEIDGPTVGRTDSVVEPEIEGEEPSPVIPCEFCTACFPVYLISEHQEMCQREANA